MTPVDQRHAEERWRSGIGPASFDEQATGLEGLGALVAAEPRFVSCTVETVHGGLRRREVGAKDHPALVAHREAFLTDLRLRTLVRPVADDEANVGEGAVDHLLAVEPIASSVEGITGVRWSDAGDDLALANTRGFHALAGGFDGAQSTPPVRTPNPTGVLFVGRLAELAGAWAAEQGSELFAHPDIDARRTSLFRRVLGRSPDDAEPSELRQLWGAVHAGAGERAANAAAPTALLRPYEFVVYG